MLDLSKLGKRHSFYDEDIEAKKYSVSIPSTNYVRSKLNSYYEKVSQLTDEFNQRNITDNDVYLVNDALGIPNSRHLYVQDVDDD